MKRLLSLLLASILLASTFMFAGCSGNGDYKEVGWDEIQKFIDSRTNLSYEDAQVYFKDGYTEIRSLYGEPVSTRITYNKDGVNLIFVEDAYEDEDGEISSSNHLYYTDGWVYRRVVESHEEKVYEKDEVDFDTALWLFGMDYAGVLANEDDLSMYYTYLLMGDDYKFYMAKTATTTKIKVVNRSTLAGYNHTNTMEYIYDAEQRLVEYYFISVDTKNQPINETKIFPTKVAPTFPDLSGFPQAN